MVVAGKRAGRVMAGGRMFCQQGQQQLVGQLWRMRQAHALAGELHVDKVIRHFHAVIAQQFKLGDLRLRRQDHGVEHVAAFQHARAGEKLPGLFRFQRDIDRHAVERDGHGLARKAQLAAFIIALPQAARLLRDQQQVLLRQRQLFHQRVTEQAGRIQAGDGHLQLFQQVGPWLQKRGIGQRKEQHLVIVAACAVAAQQGAAAIRRVAVELA